MDALRKRAEIHVDFSTGAAAGWLGEGVYRWIGGSGEEEGRACLRLPPFVVLTQMIQVCMRSSEATVSESDLWIFRHT